MPPPESFLGNFGHLPRSAPKSAFRVLFGVFWAQKCQKALKKHSLGHSEAGAQNCPKSSPGGTLSGPGPKSTPVNGGRDRNCCQYSQSMLKRRPCSVGGGSIASTKCSGKMHFVPIQKQKFKAANHCGHCTIHLRMYPLRRNDYQNNSINNLSCNCPGAITGFSCRAPKNNSPKIVSCMGPCPVRAPPVIAPGALTGFSCRAPENNSKIIFSCL